MPKKYFNSWKKHFLVWHFIENQVFTISALFPCFQRTQLFKRRRLEDVLKKVVANSISDQCKTSLRLKLRRFTTSLRRLCGGWVNETAAILTKVILNIMSNSILNEIVTIDKKDPPCTNSKIKSLIRNKIEYFKNFVKTNNPVLHQGILNKCGILFKHTEFSKPKYYSKHSKNFAINKINLKCYWYIKKVQRQI